MIQNPNERHIPTYKERAEMYNKLHPNTFSDIQIATLEATWENWEWHELADYLKAKFEVKMTKDQARKFAKKCVAYLNSHDRYAISRYDRGEGKINTLRNVITR